MSPKRRLRFVSLMLIVAGLLATLLVGRGMTADPAPPSPSAGAHDSEEVVNPSALSTTRMLTVGDVTWRITRHDSPDGPCIGVVAEVDGVDEGQVGGGCGTSDNPVLRWGLGGLEIGGQWFNVAYGEVSEAAASVRVTLGDDSVRTDSGVSTSQGVWIIVVAGEPTDRASEVARIEVLDVEGSVIAHGNPPSTVDLVRDEQMASEKETASN